MKMNPSPTITILLRTEDKAYRLSDVLWITATAYEQIDIPEGTFCQLEIHVDDKVEKQWVEIEKGKAAVGELIQFRYLPWNELPMTVSGMAQIKIKGNV